MPYNSKRSNGFAGAEDGGVAVTFALLSLVFFSLIGIAVDYSRWSNMREKASQALDAALLAGGRAMQTGAEHSEAIAIAQKHFEKLVAGKLDIINPQVTISLTANGQGLEGVAWGKMRTPFLGLVKTKSLKVAAGSLMKKLTNLDAQWTGYVNEYTDCTGGWTPGATSEDPGTSSSTCATTTAVQKTMDIVPCVTDRTGPDEFTDAAPGPNTWLNGQEGHRRVLSWDSSDSNIDPNDGSTAAKASDQWNYNDWGATCWDIDHANIIMPLTSDKDALLQRIDELVGYGATSGALGTAWSWYMISPNWSSVFTGQSVPGSYADTVPSGSSPPKLRKIAVLMTDGVYNAHRGWMGQDKDMVSSNAKSICTNMKAKGVELYTVGFDLASLGADDRTRATDVLQSCGTDLQHFYDALDAEQLKQSFRDIALQLSQLFVAK